MTWACSICSVLPWVHRGRLRSWLDVDRVEDRPDVCLLFGCLPGFVDDVDHEPLACDVEDRHLEPLVQPHAPRFAGMIPPEDEALARQGAVAEAGRRVDVQPLPAVPVNRDVRETGHLHAGHGGQRGRQIVGRGSRLRSQIPFGRVTRISHHLVEDQEEIGPTSAKYPYSPT